MPLTPSTLTRNSVSGLAKRMEETTIPLEALLATTSRAVGVFRSVNTVSKLTVSREKVSTSDGDVDMASFIHPDVIKPISAASVKRMYRIFPI